VAKSPAGSRQRPTPARDVAAPVRGHTIPTLQVVGHAGLAIDRPGGATTRRHIDAALCAGIDRLELDICCTADGSLVVRHDTGLDDGRYVGDVGLRELRSLDPFLLTLDDVCEQLDGRLPLLLDLKMPAAAEALGPWFAGRRDLGAFAVCTENLALLLHLRFAAPRVARWPSFPDLGDHSTRHVQRVVAGLWRSHASLPGLRRGVADLHRAARQLRDRPHESLARVAGLPWRERLPLDLALHCDELAPAGICVQKWLVSERLVDEAHAAGLHVNAWTVNSPAAAPLIAAAGVDSITTDRVAAIRLAVGLGRPPRLPATPVGGRLRVAGRSARS
jgi:glycerophosphoryl diester phosphodiesterase